MPRSTASARQVTRCVPLPRHAAVEHGAHELSTGESPMRR